jgi:hypothetical protein
MNTETLQTAYPTNVIAHTFSQNPPKLTFAGNYEIYARQGTDVSFTSVTLTSNNLTFIDNTQGSNVLQVQDNELILNGTVVGGGGGGDLGEWANFPMVANVQGNMSSIKNIKSISFETQNDNILAINENNDLTFNGNVLAIGGITPSRWASYPAIEDVEMETSSIKNVSSIYFQSQIQNVLTVNETGHLTYNGDILAVGSVTPATWANYEAVANINADNKNMINTNSILFKSDVTNALTVNNTNQLTYNGQVVQTGGNLDLSQWATFPAVANLEMGQHGISILPFTIGYPVSQMDTNLYIGKATYALNPDVIIYPANFKVGDLLAPATSINFCCIDAMYLTSAIGVEITGGGNLSLTGGGNVLIGSATISMNGGVVDIVGGEILMSGGSIDLLGGSVLFAGGTLTLGGAQVSLGATNLTIESGLIEVGSGKIIIGTIGSSVSQLGIQCYGGGIGTTKLGSVDGTQTLDITNVRTINGAPYVPGGGLPQSGRINFTGGLPPVFSYTITGITGMTATGYINVTCIGNADTDLGYFGIRIMTASTTFGGSVSLVFSRAVVVGDSIVWSVASLT